ncbi:MAG: hypothetical protein HKN26_05540 [Acidimicrobiales bacterium]|nr:hypothetical protein [Acidimicrobiales bacterium]
MGDEQIVFNVVWTGEVFRYLRYFVLSQFDHCGARYRFIANGCPPDQLPLMEAFAERYSDRVLDVFAMEGEMVRHGWALDAVLEQRDDGPYFGLIDPDIIAKGPFVDDFLAMLDDDCWVVSSGRSVWSESDVIPEGHVGVNGEYFYNADGFVFGAPHFALYRRDRLDETMARWNIGFGEAGNGLSDAARQRLIESGLNYWMFDTGKVVNAFLQLDGGTLRHVEHDSLLHIGGISHLLAPETFVEAQDGSGTQPDWTQLDGMETRAAIARYTASVLGELVEGRPVPPLPAGVGPDVEAKLRMVRAELIGLLDRYGDEVGVGR